MTKPSKLPTTWNFDLLIQDNSSAAMEKSQAQARQLTSEFVGKWKNNTEYLTDATLLKQALDDFERWNQVVGVFEYSYYWALRNYQDQGNTEVKAEVNKQHDFTLEMINEIEFFELQIAKIDKDLQPQLVANPLLKDYKHFLEKIFAQAKYKLSEPEEKILNLKGKVAKRNWVDMTQRFLAAEKRTVKAEEGQQEVGFSELSALISSPDKEIRDEAAIALNSIFASQLDVAEVELNSVLENKKIDDGLRSQERPDLSRHLADDIESDVVDTLIATVSRRYDITQRYYQLKAKLLGQDKLAYHERNVEFPISGGNYEYEKAIELVQDVFTELDPEFGSILKMFVDKGQIDVYPTPGKYSGAFCIHNGNELPVFILLNHNNKLGDVLTIAHETGHGINDELMRVQNSLNCGTSLATAEVASTFMEDFVFQRLIKDADDNDRLALLMSKLNDDVSTIIRQTAGYQFETELHKEFREKGYLSAVEIGNIFQKHMAAYMGDAVEQSEGAENWWVYWSHIRTFFYVYSYASGLLISKALQNLVKQDKQFITQVKSFLSSGLSASPKEIFAQLGIDITSADFWNKGLDEVDALLQETEELAKKLGKI